MFSKSEIMTGGVGGKNALTAAGVGMFLLSAVGIEKINRGEVGVVARFGRPERARGLRKGKPYRKKILQPGWHVVMPLVGSVEKISVAKDTDKLKTTVTSEEGKQVEVEVGFTWSIMNQRPAIHKALFDFKDEEAYRNDVRLTYTGALLNVLDSKPEAIMKDSEAVRKMLFVDNNYGQQFAYKGAKVYGVTVEQAPKTPGQLAADATVEAAQIGAEATVRSAQLIAQAIGSLGIGQTGNEDSERLRSVIDVLPTEAAS